MVRSTPECCIHPQTVHSTTNNSGCKKESRANHQQIKYLMICGVSAMLLRIKLHMFLGNPFKFETFFRSSQKFNYSKTRLVSRYPWQKDLFMLNRCSSARRSMLQIPLFLTTLRLISHIAFQKSLYNTTVNLGSSIFWYIEHGYDFPLSTSTCKLKALNLLSMITKCTNLSYKYKKFGLQLSKILIRCM